MPNQPTPSDNPSGNENRFLAFLPPLNMTPPAKRQRRRAPQTTEQLQRAWQRGNRRFTGLSLPGADLENAELDGGQFGLAILDEVNFRNARLNRADFSGASLNGANLQGTQLNSAVFNDCDLNNADLRGAELGAVSWDNADWDPETPPKIDHTTRLLPRIWSDNPDFVPDAEAIMNVNRQFDGLPDRHIGQLLQSAAPHERMLINEMLYAPPMVLNLENWRDRRKAVAARPGSSYSAGQST